MAQEHLTYAQGTGFKGHVLHAEQDKREGETILEWIGRLGFQPDCPLWQAGGKPGTFVAVAYPAAETPPPSASGARLTAFAYVVALQHDRGRRTECVFVRDAASLMDLRLRLLVLDAAVEG